MNWKATAATVDITPQGPVHLAGFAARTSPTTSVHSPLEANGVLLSQNDCRVLLLSFDLLYVGEPLRNFIFRICAGRISSDRILVAASHTHFAPATDPKKPQLGSVSASYMDLLKSQTERLIEQLLEQVPRNVHLQLRRSKTALAVNRRAATESLPRFDSVAAPSQRVEMAPNHSGACDQRVGLIDLVADQEVLASVWNYACHPVGFPNHQQISSEFPGVVRQGLRRDVQQAIPVVYLQGFSGNLRPRTTRRVGQATFNTTPWRRQAAQFRPFTATGWSWWAHQLARTVTNARKREATLIRGTLKASAKQLDIDEIRIDERASYQVAYQRVSLGAQLCLLAVSAEVVAEYAERVPASTLCIGCTGDVFGYLPTSGMLAEGGYEVDGATPYLELSGAYRSDLDVTFSSICNDLFGSSGKSLETTLS